MFHERLLTFRRDRGEGGAEGQADDAEEAEGPAESGGARPQKPGQHVLLQLGHAGFSFVPFYLLAYACSALFTRRRSKLSRSVCIPATRTSL
ncbi:hypothetical protein HK096_009675, partial [Nowakowskiella sp. JEL0078]